MYLCKYRETIMPTYKLLVCWKNHQMLSCNDFYISFIAIDGTI